MTAPPAGPSGGGTSRGLVFGALLVVGLVVALTLGVTAWWTLDRERHRVDDGLRADALRAADLGHLLLQRHLEQGRALLEAVAASRPVADALARRHRGAPVDALPRRDQGAAADALARRDQGAAVDALLSFRIDPGTTLLTVNDLDDRIVAVSSPLALVGVGISGRSPDPGPYPRLSRTAGEVSIVDARPVVRDGRPVGEVRAAVPVGRLFLRDASSDLGTQLAVIVDGQTVASTFGADVPEPPSGSHDNPRLAWMRTAIGDTPFDLGYRAIDGIHGAGWIVAGVSRAPAELGLRRFATLVIASSGGGLVVVLLAVGIFLGLTQQQQRLIRQRDEERRRSAGLSDRIAGLAAVVHDIKAPLAGIEMRCDGLLEDLSGLEERELRDALATIVETCDRLSLYLVNVLTVAEAEEGPIATRREVVLLPGLVEDVAEHVRPLAARRQLVLSTDAAADLPPITGDPVLLERALLNLASNAIAVTPGGGSIGLFARRSAFGITLGAWDTGPGFTAFPPEQAFSRERPRVKHASLRTSSGLGLFIVARIAEAHGGSAVAANRPEGGAVAEIRIPLANGGASVG